uniref:Reverse transcriptase/retrotransposon-derived protein RNase H-like domain-containing protein n=1 Tax=Vitis vinifera TaxID=29760 RepID=A5B4N3_VITVI|nr:hypothetical protein VITISV_043078 [Vitis vinifera]
MPPTLALPHHTAQDTKRPTVSYSAAVQPCYAAQFAVRPTTSYPRPRAQQTSAPFSLRTQRQFSQLGMPLNQALQKLIEVGLLTVLTPRPPPQLVPPKFRMDLYYVDEVPTPYVDVSHTPYVNDAHTLDVQYVIHGGRMVQQQPPAAARPLEGTFSSHRVSSVLLDNGSALNICPLATAIALGYGPSDFRPSTQTVRAYDNSRREVMGTLEIELMIGPTTFVTVFQPILQINHSDDNLFLTGFTFDEVQTLEMEDFYLDYVAMSFDHYGSTVVLEMMRSMFYLPDMGLGRRQHGPSEFMSILDHDVPFGLGFIPNEADYKYMVRLRKEWVRARLTHTLFDYPVRPYTMSLADYFVELQRLVRQLQLSDGAPGTSTSTLAAPSSLDHISLMTLYFLDEINEHETFVEIGDIVDGVMPHDKFTDEMLAISLSQIKEIFQLELASLFYLFRVSVIEIAKEILTAPTPESIEDATAVDDLFDGLVGLVEGASDFVDPPLSFDVLSGFFSLSDDVHDSSFMDFSIFEYLPVSCDVKEEIQKQLSVGFLSMVEYPKWMDNVVPVLKKDGKSIRGSIIADHLASLPVSNDRAIDDDFLDEDVATVTSLSGWHMYFDGAANHSGYGIGVLLIAPHGDHIPRSTRLAFSDRHPATNNIVEYEACILGLETTHRTSADRVMREVYAGVYRPHMGGHMLAHERRLRAVDHVCTYQRKMTRALKKRVKPRPLRIGDLVLKIIKGLIRDPKGKFRPNWSRPCFIRDLTPEGAAWLMDLDGSRFSEPTNVDQLKRYYV